MSKNVRAILGVLFIVFIVSGCDRPKDVIVLPTEEVVTSITSVEEPVTIYSARDIIEDTTYNYTPEFKVFLKQLKTQMIDMGVHEDFLAEYEYGVFSLAYIGLSDEDKIVIQQSMQSAIRYLRKNSDFDWDYIYGDFYHAIHTETGLDRERIDEIWLDK